MTFLRGRYWDQCCLTTLATWTAGLSAPSSLSVMPNSVVQSACWREGIPSTGTLTGGACRNFMKFNIAKYKGLHKGQGNPKNKYSLGNEWIESSCVEKGLGMLADEKTDCDFTVWICSPEGQLYPGWHQKCDQQVGEGDFDPLL